MNHTMRTSYQVFSLYAGGVVNDNQSADYLKNLCMSDTESRNILGWCAERGYVKSMGYLLEYFEYSPDDLTDIVKHASKNGHIEAVEILIHKGADIHGDDHFALRQAVSFGQLEMISHLVDNYIDIDRCQDGTAMRLACTSGQIETVKLLIDKRCTTHITSNLPYLRAVMHGHLPIVKFLESVNADTSLEDLDWYTTSDKSANMILYQFRDAEELVLPETDEFNGFERACVENTLYERMFLIVNIVKGTIRCKDHYTSDDHPDGLDTVECPECDVGSYNLYDVHALMLACSYVD